MVADERVAVQVDPVEDGEAEAEQGNLCVPGYELGVGVADDRVHRVGHDQAAQVPEVLVDVNLPVLTVGGGIEERLDILFHLLAPFAAEDMVWLRPHLQQEGDVPEQVIRIAV